MIYSNKIPQVRCRVANHFPKSFGHGIRLALQETRSSRSPTLAVAIPLVCLVQSFSTTEKTFGLHIRCNRCYVFRVFALS